jgi:hypothetical protein
MSIDLGQGHVFTGTALEVVAQMQRSAVGVDDLDLDEYVDWVRERAATLEGIHIAVDYGGLAARAAALVEGLVAAGLARDLDGWDDLEEDARPTLRCRVALELASVG